MMLYLILTKYILKTRLESSHHVSLDPLGFPIITFDIGEDITLARNSLYCVKNETVHEKQDFNDMYELIHINKNKLKLILYYTSGNINWIQMIDKNKYVIYKLVVEIDDKTNEYIFGVIKTGNNAVYIITSEDYKSLEYIMNKLVLTKSQNELIGIKVKDEKMHKIIKETELKCYEVINMYLEACKILVPKLKNSDSSEEDINTIKKAISKLKVKIDDNTGIIKLIETLADIKHVEKKNNEMIYMKIYNIKSVIQKLQQAIKICGEISENINNHSYVSLYLLINDCILNIKTCSLYHKNKNNRKLETVQENYSVILKILLNFKKNFIIRKYE
ncbi:hypothetical protein TCON_0640 [Astathelohania contejeani]|uniref:Uncharacterized protein n=1 Tax=Astathelohania contejeani TaxID=164912 RepID=A0ABQ7I135_9MICR|nr:hypothetical protein TCON_0640 [Thelohania contejeani]